jgi:hypothetical protein
MEHSAPGFAVEEAGLSRALFRTPTLDRWDLATDAGDFAVLSSLSGGYQLKVGRESGKILSGGYDWDNSVFDDPSTQWLKGVIYFSLGNYESRKYIFNPKFSSQFSQNGTPSS